MRSLWNGSISFGLVNIPIKLYTATSSNDIKFKYLHGVCHTPIKYRKTCPTCDQEVGEAEIVRGYEFERAQYVIMEEADLEAIAPEKTSGNWNKSLSLAEKGYVGKRTDCRS